MKDIFEFNHIDKSLSESDVTTLKDVIRVTNFLMTCLQFLEYVWLQ